MSDNYKYRDCSALIDLLMRPENASAKNIIEYAKNDNTIFIGIRNNAIELYSDGASVIKYGMKNGSVYAEINKKFLGKKEKGRAVFNDIRKIDIEMFKGVKKKAETIYAEQNKNEKICQQWIVNETNNDLNNGWYYVDMEYNTQGEHLGRFDMIAISRKPNEFGKHTVKLVELKVGTEAYGGSWIKKYNNDPADDMKYNGNYSQKYKHELVKIYNNSYIESEISADAYDDCNDTVFRREIVNKIKSNIKYMKIEENAQYYKRVKDDPHFLFNKECNKLKFGSGIVGHIADYIRFLGGSGCEGTDYYGYLKKCIMCILDCKKQIGVEGIPDIDINQLEDKPEIAIVTYVCVPCGKSISPDEEIKKSKKSMKAVISGDGEYTLRGALNKDYVSEFLKITEQLDDDKTCYHCEPIINGKKYKFDIRFIAPDNKMKFSYDCLSDK